MIVTLTHDKCRYCDELVLESELTTTHSYWGGSPFPCHKSCKVAGEKQEAYDCQVIDADCNDCKHFKRGEVIKRLLSCMEDGKPGTRLVNMGIINGHCLKFDRPTQAQPNKWTGLGCFEHRRAETFSAKA
jgi:hypothetical protein